MKNIYSFITLFLISFCSFASQPQSLFDALEQDNPLEITLQTDLTNLIENKMISSDYHKGLFSFNQQDGKKTEIPVKVKVRGKFRRKHCDFPPLKLKFKKNHLATMGLDTFNKFKLVTHCLADSKMGKEALLKEFMAYQLANVVLDNSFRTQLIKIKYVDQENKRPNVNTYAFLIEEDEEVANRMDGMLCDCMNKPMEHFDRKSAAQVALFNYMIGNTDWHLRRAKNVKLVQNLDGKLSPVPYDFDFSGLVRPLYIDFTKVKEERSYHGIDMTDTEWEEVKDHFLSKKETLLHVIKNFDQASPRAKGDMRRYIKTFYKELPDMDLSDLNIGGEKVKRVLSK